VTEPVVSPAEAASRPAVIGPNCSTRVGPVHPEPPRRRIVHLVGRVLVGAHRGEQLHDQLLLRLPGHLIRHASVLS
jgi:hypothetical protein